MEEEFLTKDKLEFLEIRNPKIQNQPAGRQVCYSKFKIIVYAFRQFTAFSLGFPNLFYCVRFPKDQQKHLVV